MLPHLHRLAAQRIREVLRTGRRIILGPLQLCYKSAARAPAFSVVVPGRIDKRATARNRQRRLIQESPRLLLPRIKPIEGVFLLVRPLTVDSTEEVKTMVVELLRKAGGMREEKPISNDQHGMKSL